MNQSNYICLRIINACLREDVGGIISNSTVVEHAGKALLYYQGKQHRLRIAVQPSDYMQPWQAEFAYWEVEEGEIWRQNSGYAAWLDEVISDETVEAQQLLSAYKAEAAAAIVQGELCAQAFISQTAALLKSPHTMSWGERMRHADQLASFLDHPYYPTARAKVGLSEADLRRYSPEFCQPFCLRWLAVAKATLTLTSLEAKPSWWPEFTHVGLAADLNNNYALIPIHPLTLDSFDGLPQGVIVAPKAWLSVYPTLSVRTVQLAEYPAEHLKVPLSIRTLGQKNIRLIKASTLYDGQWFAEVLSALSVRDPLLLDKYRHVDEQYCGHVAEEKQLAFLLRRYPAPRAGEILLPVAALGSRLPDGRLYLISLLELQNISDVSAWWQAYCQLLVDVHLTLWLRYGIALESNQQNSIVSLTPNQPLSLLMKDNDAARILPERFATACPDLAERVLQLQDPRILVASDEALAQMFITITLQLCLASVLESLAEAKIIDRQAGYHILRMAIDTTLTGLELEGVATQVARDALFSAAKQPVKYLLQSGSLLDKKISGAADINKFYGQSGPNFLRQAQA